MTDLARKIDDVCRLTGAFTLRSGQVSHEYFDKYQFESRPDLLEAVAAGLEKLLPPGTEVLAGLEMGGIPVAAALSLRTRLPVVFVRKKAKEYGTCKVAEGVAFKDRRVVIIEDVVTTGGAIIEGARALREGGARLERVLCVIDREQGGAEKLKEAGLTLAPLLTKSQLAIAGGKP